MWTWCWRTKVLQVHSLKYFAVVSCVAEHQNTGLQNGAQQHTGKHRCKNWNRVIARSILSSDLILEAYLDGYFCRNLSLASWLPDPMTKIMTRVTFWIWLSLNTMDMPLQLTILQDFIRLDWSVGLSTTKSVLILTLYFFFFLYLSFIHLPMNKKCQH